MSNFKRKDVKEMTLKELEDYIKQNSLKNLKMNFSIEKNKNEENDNFSNSLNYNYLDNKNLPDKNLFESKDEEIQKLLKENNELKFDMKQLFFLLIKIKMN